ncbi:lipopolysaccharide biosynthesis protein [Marinobacter adhaerens]|uniref:Wzz/FepE/Etk N-terminal domain-containing protein n=1 Tax=Marinobacter adhaerens TaxID=1033846 RepID=UPI000840B353|nr:Wzz/FepE/Etk N-terminal domain-containing protein [Marinobacter adhaerens]ODM31897.1 lipopolysaccharide biosynthesis protein [Marinobacter adhaerens]
MSDKKQRELQREEIDLVELAFTIWRSKWLISIVIFLFVLLGVAYALIKPNIYQAYTVVTPVEQDSGDLSRLAGQIGGFASLAGINLGGGGSNKIEVAKQVIQSREFVVRFLKRNDLIVPLMAVEGWDEETNSWHFDRDIYDPIEKTWKIDEDGESLEPTDWDLVEKFLKDHFSLSQSEQSGMITIAIKHYSPFEAKRWLDLIVNDLNENMREKDIVKSKSRIEYLERKLESTAISEMEKMFYKLIENETRTVMLANAQKEYVFEVIDPSIVPEDHKEPKRVLVIVLTAFLGFLVGCLVVICRAVFRNYSEHSV